MNKHKHFGVYGLIIKDNQILLINKVTGPYNGKLDLPGGTIEFTEKPVDTLKRELLEETGIEITDCTLFDADSVVIDWEYKNEKIKTHHTGIFYKVLSYNNDIKKEIKIDSTNDDSLGADFYNINKLTKNKLSAITILELEKLGYKLK